MIGYLTGTIRNKKATEVIIDTNGVGYLCKISVLTSEKIGSNGETVELFIHTYVREDDISLFGFLSEIEKEIYLKLISVSGIGSKMGLAVQSTFSASDLLDIVRNEQVEMLVMIPGVGKKTAERLILELKDKFKLLIAPRSEKDIAGSLTKDLGTPSLISEAVFALEALGFYRKKCEMVVTQIMREQPDINIEGLIRQSLKAMR